MTGAISPSLKAIVAYYRLVDLPRLRRDNSWVKLASAIRYPVWTVCEPDLESRSPVTVPARIKAPVLLIHGDSDSNISPGQSEEMETAIVNAGGNAQLHLVSGAGHGFLPFVSDGWPATLEFLADKLQKNNCVVGGITERRDNM